MAQMESSILSFDDARHRRLSKNLHYAQNPHFAAQSVKWPDNASPEKERIKPA